MGGPGRCVRRTQELQARLLDEMTAQLGVGDDGREIEDALLREVNPRPAAILLVCWSLGIVVLPARTAAQEQPLHTRLKLGLGYDFTTGTYGSSERTDISYLPLTVHGEVDLWTLKLVVPYIRIDGPGGFIDGPNGPIATESGVSEGLGDIIASGTYTLLPLASWMPFIDLIVRIKFPAADESKGLGTGEFDYTLETEIAHTFGKLTPLASLGYRFVGSPSGTNLNDVVLASAGGVYQVIDPLSLGVVFDYRQAAARSSDGRRELVPFATWTVSPHWTTSLYTVVGFSNASPDAGVGAQLSYTL